MIKFTDLNLNPNIIKAISELGFETPTEIQEKAIPMLLESDTDLIGLAQTGTGKTAAFGLPVIDKINTESKDTQAIILSPTRELCIQIAKDLDKYSKYIPNLRVTAIYGGASVETQIKQLAKGAQIVAGTPGRVIDLIKRKKLKIGKIKWLILDEADEMLNMGFKEDLDTILESTPEKKQTLLFSATMPKKIVSIANKYMNEPEKIVVGRQNTGAENVKHVYFVMRASDRYKALKRIADVNPDIYGIIFCRTRRETKEVSDKLMQEGYNAEALHGDLSQAQRDYVMNRFRTRHLQLLVATDVAARGLDVTDLTHVINYNLPEDVEIYVHRSGRTGRAGKTGVSMSLIHSRETRKLHAIEKIVGKKFDQELIPKGTEICKKQLFNFIDKVEKIEVDETQIEQFIPEISAKLDWMSKDEIIKHFVSAEFNRFLSYYKNAPDLNVGVDKKSKGKGEGRQKTEAGFTRFFINIGKDHRLAPANLIGLINDKMKTRGIDIGKIDIMKKFSFFEIDSQYEDEILSSFENSRYRGFSVSVEIASDSDKAKNSGGGGGSRNSRRRNDSHRKGNGGNRKGGSGGGRKDYRRKK